MARAFWNDISKHISPKQKLPFPNSLNFTFVILKQSKFEYENLKNSIFEITRKNPLITHTTNAHKYIVDFETMFLF